MEHLSTIIANANEDELRVIASVLKRAHDQPAIVVTLTDRKRYVVAQEDEPLFDDVPDGRVVRQDRFGGPQFSFGGQWLRGYGRVDEMYRTLAGHELTKVARVDRHRVWGTP